MEKSYIKIADTGDGLLVSGFSTRDEMLSFFLVYVYHLLRSGFSFDDIGDVLNIADDLYQECKRTGTRL